MSGAGPWGEAEDELALADRAYFVALAGIEVDEAWGGQRPLGGVGGDEQVTSQEEHERVLVYLMLLQGLALGE